LAIKLPTLTKKSQTPTRQVTGTTYTVDPALAPKPANYSEMGSARATPVRERVPELANRRLAAQTYKIMERTDASIRVSLRSGKTPILGADYYMEAFDETEQNQVINEFCDFNVFHAMTTPWLDVLQNICHFMEDGFQVFEPVWELREWAPKKTSATANRKKYTMLRKLAVRPSTTISQFLYDDNGGPTGVKHQAIKADGTPIEVEIPIEKLVIFTFDKQGGNLEGQSILRSAYTHWFYKKTLYEIDAIQKERHSIGVPDAELLPGYNAKDEKAAFELVQNLRTNELAGIVRTTKMNVGFAELKGNLVNPLESANHHDNMIMKNIMVQFLNLGIEGSGGGRATGATAADMFLKAMRFLANLICDYFNQYIIPNLVAYNFKSDQFPKLKVRNIGEIKDFQMWAAGFSNLVQQSVITMDLETENFVRDFIDFPKKLGDRPEFTPQQVRENILLQGQVNPGATPAPGTTPTPAAPADKTTPGGVILPAGGGGKSKTGSTLNIGKSPTSGAV
jgi:hypothetical protein